MPSLRILMSVALLTACAAKDKAARNIIHLYQTDVAELREVMGTTIALPGVLGSQIVDSQDGRLYWGEVLGSAAKPTKNAHDALKLALPMREGASLRELNDELEAGLVLASMALRVAGTKVYVRAYPGVFSGILKHLAAGETKGPVKASSDELMGRGMRNEFGYDWRRELTAELERLDAFVQRQATLREELTGNRRIDLMAHSMGTQITRYYLRYGTQPLPGDGSLPELTWAGARHIHNAILMAPPNAGSPVLFENLVNGKHVATGLPHYPTGLLVTFPSLFYMLPRVRHNTVVYSDTGESVDFFDMELWRQYQWGALHPDQDEMVSWVAPHATTREQRVSLVDEHIAKSLAAAEQFHAAMDRPARAPAHLKIHLFAGDAHPTPSVFEVDRETGEVSLKEHAPGDGEVTRASALLDERAAGTLSNRMQTPIPWHAVHFSDGTHIGITGRPNVIDDVLYILLQARQDAPEAPIPR